MCGIVGILRNTDLAAGLLAGLKTLEYRGYDSCGMALINNNQITMLKGTGGIDEVNQRYDFLKLAGKIGIAHTRWATHGQVTQANAHPFYSADKNFALIHNGIINNYADLKRDLLNLGYKFNSDTDSEVIVNLLEENYKQIGKVQEAFGKTLSQLDGCYAIAMICTHEPDRIFGAKYLLPLVVGIGEDAAYLCSDVLAFADHTDQALRLEDKEYVVLGQKSAKFYSLESGKEIAKEPVKIKSYDTLANKGDYQHFMLKEIFDEPQAIIASLDIDREQIKAVAKKLSQAKSRYIVGIGTTYYVAKAAGYLLNEWAKIPCSAIPADEFLLQANSGKDSTVVFASQSGETFDTKEALRAAKAFGFSTSAIVNAPNSTIAQIVDDCIFQNSGLEVSVVSTKAALAQISIFYQIAWYAALDKGLLNEAQVKTMENNFRLFAKKLTNLLPIVNNQCKLAAVDWSKYKHFLCLGKGIYYPFALETALKIKEVAYIHAEGMPTGFLKHGTLALIDSEVPCLFFVPAKSDKAAYESTVTAIEEVKARFGITLGFCSADDETLRDKFDFAFLLPEIDPTFTPIYQLIVAQLFAYHLANNLKRPIDKPRNLAKSVTVP